MPSAIGLGTGIGLSGSLTLGSRSRNRLMLDRNRQSSYSPVRLAKSEFKNVWPCWKAPKYMTRLPKVIAP
ncbi:Uncharacterised protein [uncultured archaeon]|nr:Uncharacterised protein [uncultured archaeon]